MWWWTSGEIRANVLRETASPRTLAVLVDFVLMGFDVGGHGWPQYCVTRAVLHCLIHNSQFFEWLSSREKSWLMAYARPASSDQIEVAYDKACESGRYPHQEAAKLFVSRRPGHQGVRH